MPIRETVIHPKFDDSDVESLYHWVVGYFADCPELIVRFHARLRRTRIGPRRERELIPIMLSFALRYKL